MSQAPGQELGGLGRLFFGIFYLSIFLVPIAAIVGANWLFKRFLVEVCDAKPSDSGDPVESATSPTPHVQNDPIRTVIGAGMSLIAVLLLATTEAASTSSDIGLWQWPLYWAIVFGPYYLVRYWGAPRRGGSSSRIVLLLVSGAVAIGWTFHLGLWRSQ